MQAFLRTAIHTLQAENTFRAVHALARIIPHIHIHGTNALALTAGDAGLLIIFYPQQRKIAGWL